MNAGLLWRYTSETVKIRQATQRQSELADAQLRIPRSQLKHRDDAGLAALKESIAGVDRVAQHWAQRMNTGKTCPLRKGFTYSPSKWNDSLEYAREEIPE